MGLIWFIKQKRGHYKAASNDFYKNIDNNIKLNRDLISNDFSSIHPIHFSNIYKNINFDKKLAYNKKDFYKKT